MEAFRSIMEYFGYKEDALKGYQDDNNRLTTFSRNIIVRIPPKRLLLQALLLCPQITSISRAEKLMDDMLDLQREYLPEFHD